MSAKTMAASNENRRIGCRVASAALAGSRQKLMKSDVSARRALYSGRYRPAWRMNQMGGRSSRSPASTLSRAGCSCGGRSADGAETDPDMRVLNPLLGQGSRRAVLSPSLEKILIDWNR
jgi:hypothetical protein